MTIKKDQCELFRSGTDFKQILFLDNFYENINVEIAEEKTLSEILQLAISSKNDYIKRAAFKILCDLSLAGKINHFNALAELHTLLDSNIPTLQAIAVKYLPYFPIARTTDTIEKLKELSDNPNGDVASQAYFCLGLFQLTESTSLSNIAGAIICLENAESHFTAASISVENRTDSDFYLAIIAWLKSALSNNSALVKEGFQKIEEALITRNLYEFDDQNLELDFLVFHLVKQLRITFSISNTADRWLEIKNEVKALLDAFDNLRKVKESTTSSRFITERLFSNLFETIEEGIYQIHLTSSKPRLKALQEHTSETEIAQYLHFLLPKLPEDQQDRQDNPELLALLSEIEGSEKGLALYQSIANKSGSTELLQNLGNLTRKYKSQSLPYKTGTIKGQEIYNELRERIEEKLSDYPEEKLEAYFKVVTEVIRYARTTFVDSDRKRFPFLYTKSSNFQLGKGQQAIEQDLQDSMLHFFEYSTIKDGLDHEKARFVDGGRVDILYKKELITISIELKKSLNRPSDNDLEENYISQAQTYTAGYDQLGIFVLLELSDKGTEPPPNFKDWFKIHHLSPSTNLELNYPDYVISVVIPGNRTSPSAKSIYK